MMKKIWLKTASFLLAASMMLVVGGCGKDTEPETIVSEIEVVEGDDNQGGENAVSGGDASGSTSGIGSGSNQSGNVGNNQGGNTGNNQGGNTGNNQGGNNQGGNTGYTGSGKVTDLKGRTIKMGFGIIQTDPDDPSSAEGIKLMAKRKSVEQKLNCKLQSVTIVGYEQVQASILAGSPSVDIWNLIEIPQFMSAYKSGLLQQLDSLNVMNLKDRARYSEYTETMAINGQHYGFNPQTYGVWKVALSNVMYVNKKKLATYGYNMSDIYKMQNDGTWTWSKFREIAAKCSEPAKGVYAINDATSNFYNDLMASNDTDWIRKSGNSFQFSANEAKAQEVMNYYKSLVDDKSLSVAYDPKVGTATNDPLYDYDLITFKNGKTTFFNAKAYLPFKNYLDSMQNDIGIVFCPKPDGAKGYKSYTNHACMVGIPVYSGKDANLRARETATVIEELFGPYKSEKEYNNQMRDDVRAFANDNEIIKTYQAIFANQRFSYSGIAGEVERGNNRGWLDFVPQIAQGKMDYSSVVNAQTSRYNGILSSWNAKN